MAYPAQTFAAAHVITSDEVPVWPAKLDSYARRGAVLSRDAASIVIAALSRDSHELRTRGGAPNLEQAELQDALQAAILKALR